MATGTARWRFYAMPDEIIGIRQFSNGSFRTVFEDARGQYVIDDSGHRVHGSWIVEDKEFRDPPLIVESPREEP
jgi:hypothetical protein